MARQKLPLCFVAMAFGKEDTDSFYNKLILPVLKKNAIRPVIINRRQSNDDLNMQIIEQIKLADLCIVDLTYARPSVYFEAGFAQQRGIPVIYTVRSDHLRKGQPDELRVHFDLAMKPIIKWDGVNDKSFQSHIEKRIKSTFLNNWNRQEKNNQKYLIAEESFQKLPTSDRLQYIRFDALNILKRIGYSHWEGNDHLDHRWSGIDVESAKYISSLRKGINNGSYNYSYGYKIKKKKLHVAAVQSFFSPTKDELLRLEKVYSSGFYLPRKILELFEDNKLSEIYVKVFILSINKLLSSRIENILQDVAPLKSSQHYHDTYYYGHNYKIKVYIEYIFLSGIKSRLHLKEQIKNHL